MSVAVSVVNVFHPVLHAQVLSPYFDEVLVSHKAAH